MTKKQVNRTYCHNIESKIWSEDRESTLATIGTANLFFLKFPFDFGT